MIMTIFVNEILDVLNVKNQNKCLYSTRNHGIKIAVHCVCKWSSVGAYFQTLVFPGVQVFPSLILYSLLDLCDCSLSLILSLIYLIFIILFVCQFLFLPVTLRLTYLSTCIQLSDFSLTFNVSLLSSDITTCL